MKLSQLLRQLVQLDPDLDVLLEGCDCVREAGRACVVKTEEYYDEPEKTWCLIRTIYEQGAKPDTYEELRPYDIT